MQRKKVNILGDSNGIITDGEISQITNRERYFIDELPIKLSKDINRYKKNFKYRGS